MLQYFFINENLLANLKVFRSIKIVECVTTHSYCEVPFSNYEIWLLRAPSAPFSTSKWATYVSTYMMSASETILKNWGGNLVLVEIPNYKNHWRSHDIQCHNPNSECIFSSRMHQKWADPSKCTEKWGWLACKNTSIRQHLFALFG